MVIKCAISGSFRKSYEEILTTIEIFENNGIQVLSPKKSIVVDQKDGFVFLQSDATRSVRKLEDRHLKAIKNSHFLYVCNPNGYLGHAVIFEMGYAHRNKTSIFSLESVNDVTLKEYVTEIISSSNLCCKIKKGAYTF
jgi:hypothetical protein